MSVHVPQLPLQLDPLIAEAKRRARYRRLTVVAAVLLATAALGAFIRWELAGPSAGTAAATSGVRCARSSTYGTQCIDVFGPGRLVRKIQTSFDGTGMFWPNTRWRIDLERYVCDPVGTSKARCWAATTWHGRVMTGARVVDRRTQPLHLAQSRRDGYWRTFPLPHTFRSNAWLCTEAAVYNPAMRRWVYNGAGLPHGLRACVLVDR